MEIKKNDNRDEQFESLGGNATRNAIDMTSPNNNAAAIRFFLAAFAILIFLGNDIAKLLLRKNYSVSKIELARYYFVFLLFIACGIGCFIFSGYMVFDKGTEAVSFFSFSEFVTGVIFVWLAIRLIKKARNFRRLTLQNDLSLTADGECDLLGFLGEYCWSERKIKFVGEPFYLILLAVLSVFANLVGGLPLLYSAISIWLYGLLEIIFPKLFLPEINKKPVNPPDQFHQVGTD